jgi:penicillin V acylase-like amidase (Ntn superfamily)
LDLHIPDMKKIFLLITACIIPFTPMYPCTTFVLKTKNGLFFGRNLDWVSDLGLVIVNQRGVSKESLVFPPEKPISWTSTYGSITFNQFGKEFPFGGINEKGLVIEIMVSAAEYADPDERPIVNELQWIQYQLDNCATVQDVINTDAVLRIGQTHEILHYLICDAEGNTAVIELKGGKMVVYRGDDLPVPVLENDDYQTSLEHLSNEKNCRFTKAADYIKKYKGSGGQSAIDYSFKILEEVALSAEWSVVYDITNKEIHFSTSTNRDLRKIKMNEFDFTCNNQSLSYDLSGEHTGEVNNKFVKLKSDANTEVLKKAMELNAVNMETVQANMVAGYFKECKCSKE